MTELNLNPLEIRDLISRYTSELKKLKFQIDKTKNTIAELEEVLKSKGVGGLIQKPDVEIEGESVSEAVEAAAQPAPETKKKKKRGRPKKKKEATVENKPKRGRGRPKKTETAEAEAKPKRGPGRPKKSETTKAEAKPKRGPGRPPKPKAKEALPTVVVDNKPKAKRRVRFNEMDVFLIETLTDKGKILIAADLLNEGLKMAASKGEQVTEDEMKTRINRSLQKLSNRRDEIKKVKFQGRGFAYALPSWIDKKGTLKPEFMR
jgi:outer membrane biosynthesis protein TonB